MYKILLLASTLALTGCGTYGEPLILSKLYTYQDPCITTKYSGTTPEQRASQMPSYCGGSSRGAGYIYDRNGVWQGRITQK